MCQVSYGNIHKMFQDGQFRIFTVFALNCNVHPVVPIVSFKSEAKKKKLQVQGTIRDDTSSTFFIRGMYPKPGTRGMFCDNGSLRFKIS